MLNFTLEEQINPNKEILVLLNKVSYKVNKGAIKVLNGTNLKFRLFILLRNLLNLRYTNIK